MIVDTLKVFFNKDLIRLKGELSMYTGRILNYHLGQVNYHRRLLDV